MSHAYVAAVMSADVVTVAEDTPFKEIVQALTRGQVSAAPVVNAEGQLVGIVTEADLLAKQEFQEACDEHRLLSSRRERLARAKARAIVAAELMTAPAITVGPHEPVWRAARLMARHGVNRLPVVDEENHVVGLVSRADVLRVFLRSDEAILAEIQQDVIEDALWIDPSSLTCAIADGMVTLRGQVRFRSDAAMAVRLTRAVDGVVDVDDQLTYDMDDSDVPLAHRLSVGTPAGRRRPRWPTPAQRPPGAPTPREGS